MHDAIVALIPNDAIEWIIATLISLTVGSSAWIITLVVRALR